MASPSSPPCPLPYSDKYLTLSTANDNPTLRIHHYSIFLRPLTIPLSSIVSLHRATGGISYPSGELTQPIPWYTVKIWGMGLGNIWWAWGGRARWGLIPQEKFRKDCWVIKRVGEIIEVGFSTVDPEEFWRAVTEGWVKGEVENEGLPLLGGD